jgi:hypothetical protein
LPEARSRSFLSLAENREDLKKIIYSLELEPILAAYSASNSHRMMKQSFEVDVVEADQNGAEVPNRYPFQFDLPAESTLTIGGYDTNDFVGNLTWYNTNATATWNLTGEVITIGEEMNINPNGTDFEIEI